MSPLLSNNREGADRATRLDERHRTHRSRAEERGAAARRGPEARVALAIATAPLGMTDLLPASVPLEALPGVHPVKKGCKTLEVQSKLPALPLPSLDHTLALYLRSLIPLLSPAEYSAACAVVGSFGQSGGQGRELQQILEKQASACGQHLGYPRVNWLEQYWEEYAYLRNRSPLVPHNMFSTLFDASCTNAPLRRAAGLVYGATDFYLRLRRGDIAPDSLDTQGNMPLCMHQFSRLFAHSRVPGVDCDAFVGPRDGHMPRHIVVFCKGHAYSLDVVLPDEASCLPFGAVEAALASISRHASQRVAPAESVCALTSAPRDEWARLRDAVTGAAPCNAAAVDAIESALFCVTLSDNAPPSPVALLRATMLGDDGRSVWYDKCFSFIVFANGRAGVHSEHGHFDGPISARLSAFVRRVVGAVEAQETDTRALRLATEAAAHSPQPRACWATPLEVCLSAIPQVRAAVPKLSAAFAAMASVTRITSVRFNGGGRCKLRKELGVQPDSAVQMALQLAYARDQRATPATYETATTRRFAHGRTETIRVTSAASAAFTAAMADSAVDTDNAVDAVSAVTAKRGAALRAAMREHGEWAAACVSGMGVDRHLMALRIAAAEAAMDTPQLFRDAGYARSTNFTLSTSNMSTPGIGPDALDMCGFAAPTVDSYGVCYGVQDHCIGFTVSSHADADGRCHERFAATILQAMADVISLLEATSDKQAKSKL